MDVETANWPLCPLASDRFDIRTGKGPFPTRNFHKTFGLTGIGCVIHYTGGGHWRATAEDLRKKNLGYHFLIERDGSIVQILPLTEHCWHAGRAKWRNFSPNWHFLAISVCSYGLLKERDGRFYAWPRDYGFELDQSRRRVERRSGEAWEAATIAQEQSLIHLAGWMVKTIGVSPDLICGHEECSLAGKVDPGGVIPWTMDDFRKMMAAL